MNREADIRAAVEREFGDAVEYRRPIWQEGSVGFCSAAVRSPGTPKLKDALSHLDAEAWAGRNFAVLVPARTDTGWCWDYCRPWEVRFLRGRVRFDGHRGGAPFPSMLIVMGPVAKRGVVRHWQPFPQMRLFPKADVA